MSVGMLVSTLSSGSANTPESFSPKVATTKRYQTELWRGHFGRQDKVRKTSHK